MLLLPSVRSSFLIVFLGCAGLMLGGVYFQYVLDLAPCPLCITQRVFICAVGLAALVIWAINPATLWKNIFAVINILLAIAGGGVSARHVWLQNLPEDQVPTCGPGLSYMFEALPLAEAFSVLFAGDGNCANVVWRFLGLSIPAWTLVAFTGLVLFHVWIIIRNHANGT